MSEGLVGNDAQSTAGHRLVGFKHKCTDAQQDINIGNSESSQSIEDGYCTIYGLASVGGLWESNSPVSTGQGHSYNMPHSHCPECLTGG